MDFLAEYGMFLAQAITIVIAIMLVIGAIANAGQKNKKQPAGHIEIINLSEEYSEVKDGMLKEILSDEEYKLLLKEKKKKDKAEQKERKKAAKLAAKANAKNTAENETEEDDSDSDEQSKRLFVLDFDGDVEASAVENLREEITAIISAAEKGDEVLVKVESPGGMVHAYGFAASQLSRIKDAGLILTVAVDQVAASGGYMMACVANKIIAAPFAIVGSIGVVAEIPNFHRLLKHNKVDYEQHTAGEYKRTLTMFAENTDEARTKFKQELQETHGLFKQFINENRPALEVDKVATGEHWYGSQALTLGLIDEIKTSDDYLLSQAEEREIFGISYEVKKPLAERLSFSVQSAIEKGVAVIWKKNIESRLFRG
ncbi:protease SohB [Aliikangiella maris]|uniref:Protease SohB n=2 Tax=Aliikangiella maris TaxID=3162458 RepID=A0ABV3MRL5_9GAMM